MSGTVDIVFRLRTEGRDQVKRDLADARRDAQQTAQGGGSAAARRSPWSAPGAAPMTATLMMRGPAAAVAREPVPAPLAAMDRANRLGFRFGMLAMTAQFGGMPLIQANQAAQAAGREALGMDADRSLIDLERRQGLARLGRQAEGQQRSVDRLAAGGLNWAADRGLGNALPWASGAVQAVGAGANVGSLVAALGGLLPATVANTGATAANAAALAALTVSLRAGGLVSAAGGPAASAGATAAGAGLGARLGAGIAAVGGSIQATLAAAGTGGVAASAGIAATTVGALLAASPRGQQFAEESGDPLVRTVAGHARGLVENVPLIGGSLRTALAVTAPRQDAQAVAARGFREEEDLRPSEESIVSARAAIESIRAAGDPTLRAISVQLRAADRRREVDSYGAAAEQERLGQVQGDLQTARRQRGILWDRQDEARQYARTVQGQEADRARLGVQYGRSVRDAALSYERNDQAITRNQGRQERDINQAYTYQIEDIGTQRGNAQEDAQRGYGRQVRDINQSEADNADDIRLNGRRTIRNLVLGRFLRGFSGQLIQARLGQRDALEDNARSAARARARAGVGLGDTQADIGLGATRSVAAAGLSRDRGLAGANLGAADAREDNLTSAKQAVADAGRAYTQTIDEVIKAQQKELAYIAEDQTIREARRKALEADNAAEDALRKKVLEGVDGQIKLIEEQTTKLKGVNKEMETVLNESKSLARRWSGGGE